MDGIFSKNLIEFKSSQKEKMKEDIESFLKSNCDSKSFSDDYFYIYNQLKNQQSNFFSKNLLDEINYINVKGGDFFGAFTNSQKKVNYFLKSYSNDNNNLDDKPSRILFGIPILKEKIQINKIANLALKNKIEDEFEKYLNFYPDESNGFANGFLNENEKNKIKSLNNNVTNPNNKLDDDNNYSFNKKSSFSPSKKNKFDNIMLIDDHLNLPLRENDEDLTTRISTYNFIYNKNLLYFALIIYLKYKFL